MSGYMRQVARSTSGKDACSDVMEVHVRVFLGKRDRWDQRGFGSRLRRSRPSVVLLLLPTAERKSLEQHLTLVAGPSCSH